MQPTVKSYVFPFLCLVALLGLASGLTMERVRLVNNLTYIEFGLGASASNSLLECLYKLDEGEDVRRVYWEMWDDIDKLGTYEWRPGSGGNATGRLEGVVELNRDDGSLELTKLRYDLYGMYSCGVSLTNGVTKNTAKEEVLIVDMSGSSTFSEHDNGCTCDTSYQSPAVFPEPTLHAGMFSPKLNKYYEEVSSQEWLKVIHPNGSVTYSYNDISFVIDHNTPDDAVFQFMMGIIKSDGEYISLDWFTSYSSWHELGCPDVKEYNKDVHYFPADSVTCRGERKNMTVLNEQCKVDYQHEGDVGQVVVRCNGTSLMWEPEQHHTANLEDLVCVPRPIVHLVNNRTYIDYGLGTSANNSLIDCDYHLDEGEEVSRVFWEMSDEFYNVGTYEWRPGSGGNATGRLEGVVELNRGDGSLELTKLRYDLGGKYSCSVILTNGVTKDSLWKQVFIVDIGGRSLLSENFRGCFYTTTYESPAVFPEPTTLHAGMYSPKLNKYYEEVSWKAWSKVTHSNGSVTYSYNDVTFKIDEKTPDDIVFKLMNGFFSNMEYIPLDDYSKSYSFWNEVGCPYVREDNKEVHYSPGESFTCHGGLEDKTMATVTCRNGYQAEGDVSLVTMRCNGTSLTWEPEQGQTATIEDLVCVKNADTTVSTVTTTENPGGGASSGNPRLVLISASLLGVVVLFKFNHP